MAAVGDLTDDDESGNSSLTCTLEVEEDVDDEDEVAEEIVGRSLGAVIEVGVVSPLAFIVMSLGLF